MLMVSTVIIEYKFTVDSSAETEHYTLYHILWRHRLSDKNTTALPGTIRKPCRNSVVSDPLGMKVQYLGVKMKD